MKIFSNFDTKIKQKTYQENVQKYGSENTLYFGRSGLYFFIKIFLPIVFILLCCIGIIVVYYILSDGQYLGYFSGGVGILSLFFLVPLMRRRIDYKMDFIVVTPDFLVMYNQNGILAKKVITANAKSIKTVSVERSGFLYSLFNNGDVIVLSEGDAFLIKDVDKQSGDDEGIKSRGEIILKRVHKPEEKRLEMLRLLRK